MATIQHTLADSPGLLFAMQYDDVTNQLLALVVQNASGVPGTLRIFQPVIGETLIVVPDGTDRTIDLVALGITIILPTHLTKGGILTVGLPPGVELGWRT